MIKAQGRMLQSDSRGKEPWYCRHMKRMMIINEIDRNEGQEVGCIFESRVRIKQQVNIRLLV